MLNLISLVIGGVAVVPILLALIPLLGWANWIILPLPVVGFIIGSMSAGSAGRNLNLALIVVAILRLMLGGGLF